MTSITLKAPAKINLALRVGGRRDDGFHEIRSLMQAVSLYDELTISIAESDLIEDLFVVTGPHAESVPDDNEDNLAFKAIQEIRGSYPGLPPLIIELVKNIPVGAGLGGGSSDAAAALIGMNRLFDLDFDIELMSKLGAVLGSDVPFFFSSGSALVSGRGEIVEDIELPLDYYLELIIPPERVSTAEAYRALNRPSVSEKGGDPSGERLLRRPAKAGLLAMTGESPTESGPTGSQLAEGNEDTGLTLFTSSSNFCHSGTISDLLPALLGSGNDFEDKFLEVNDLQKGAKDVAESLGVIQKQFRSLGSRLTRLSGSGSAVFGIFDSVVPHERLQAVLREGWLAHSARPISLPADSSP